MATSLTIDGAQVALKKGSSNELLSDSKMTTNG